MPNLLSRRNVLTSAALSAGAVALLKGGLTPVPASAQNALPSGTVHSFSKNGVRFHTYVSPAQTVNVTSHVLELGDQLLVADATMLPPTAAEVGALIASTGKPVHTAYVIHDHPDHWGGVGALGNISFSTLPEVRENLRQEATSGEWLEPTSLLNGADIALETTDIGGVPVEFRAYDDNEALKMLVAVLPDQKVAIVQDLVYNGVYFAPGMDRANWINTLQTLRDDPAFETLLVGHGLPTTRAGLTTAIEYLKTMDRIWNDAETADDFVSGMKAAYPGCTGEFLLNLAKEYWNK